MRTHYAEYLVSTSKSLDFVDITDDVQGTLEASAIRSGQVTLFCAEAACSIIVNEKESGLLADIARTIERLGASSGRAQRSMLGSSSVVLPALDGKLRLGSWQRVLLVELEESDQAQERKRSIVVQIVGE